jgi:hypothetical protein
MVTFIKNNKYGTYKTQDNQKLFEEFKNKFQTKLQENEIDIKSVNEFISIIDQIGIQGDIEHENELGYEGNMNK